VTAAPKTGQHTVEDDLRDEALSYFFDSSEVKTSPTTGGVNNVVQVRRPAAGAGS
jgi:hypothetical protein